jgi:hypothetical protein
VVKYSSRTSSGLRLPWWPDFRGVRDTPALPNVNASVRLVSKVVGKNGWAVGSSR